MSRRCWPTTTCASRSGGTTCRRSPTAPPRWCSPAATARARPLHVGTVPPAEPDLHPRGECSMRPCAIVGVGQTHHKSRRLDVSFGGLVREAVFRALDDAHMTMADIDAVVLGKAPDLFEG